MEALEQRAVTADQRRLRTHLIQLAGVRTGDTGIEVGCGTGALLADLTRAVRPGGHAIGIEPQPGDTNASSYLFGMAERLAFASREAGVVDKEEAIRWIDELRDLAAQGNFFSSINYYACVGVRA
jgi:ubiquinone/menaquinone biosynthesis C-methylase UbiE